MTSTARQLRQPPTIEAIERVPYFANVAYNQFYVSIILQTLSEAACPQVTSLHTPKELIIVRRNSLLATISNLKNNLIPILKPQHQLVLGGFNLLALALTPKGKPSGLKNYNNYKGDINNVLSFINYITTDKQADGLPPIKIKIQDAKIFIKIVA